MGRVSQVHMKPGCVPSKFECQKRTCSTERPCIAKKQKMEIIAECLKEPEASYTPSTSGENTFPTSSGVQYTTKIIGNNKYQIVIIVKQIYFVYTPGVQAVEENVPKTICVQTADKLVQTYLTHKFKCKAFQTKMKTIDIAVSLLRPTLISSCTSPFKADIIKKSTPDICVCVWLKHNYKKPIY